MATLRQSTVIETYAEDSGALQAACPVGLQYPAQQASTARSRPMPKRYPRDRGFLEVRRSKSLSPSTLINCCRCRAGPSPASAPGQVSPRTPAQAFALGSVVQVTTLGFVDLAGQLRALDQFLEGLPVPFWFRVLLVLVYVCIGPDAPLVSSCAHGGYVGLVLARWSSFSAAAYGLASGLKGRQLLTRWTLPISTPKTNSGQKERRASQSCIDSTSTAVSTAARRARAPPENFFLDGPVRAPLRRHGQHEPARSCLPGPTIFPGKVDRLRGGVDRELVEQGIRRLLVDRSPRADRWLSSFRHG